jgi:hypothetical protein
VQLLLELDSLQAQLVQSEPRVVARRCDSVDLRGVSRIAIVGGIEIGRQCGDARLRVGVLALEARHVGRRLRLHVLVGGDLRAQFEHNGLLLANKGEQLVFGRREGDGAERGGRIGFARLAIQRRFGQTTSNGFFFEFFQHITNERKKVNVDTLFVCSFCILF